MDWQIIVSIAVIAPVILLPITIAWYLNFESIIEYFRAAYRKEEDGK